MSEALGLRALGDELAARLTSAREPAHAPPRLSRGRFLALSLVAVAAWWVLGYATVAGLTALFHLPIPNYDAQETMLELAVGALVLAPVLENALAIWAFRLVRGKAGARIAFVVIVGVIAALHLIYGWRALAAVGIFAAVLASYAYWERESPRFAWISGMVLHLAFNLPSTVLMGLGRAGYLG